MSTDYEYVDHQRDGDFVTLTMNHPAQRNVLSRQLLEELIHAFSEVGRSDASGVILAARGKVFSAGHDFAELAGLGIEGAHSLFSTCTSLMNTMQSIPQPVVARVHALATGAGCQLVAAADLAVASEDASFCAPGGRGGLFCTTPMVAIGRSVSRKHALEMAMSGDPIDATTAAQWGLINLVVAATDLEKATNDLLSRVTRGSHSSKGIGKRAFYAQIGLEQSRAYDLAIDVMAAASQGASSQEGIAAFLEKRPPEWPH